MISEETMRCRKVRRILQYHILNKLLPPEKFAHHALLLFNSFRDEKFLSGFPPLYQNKLQKEGFQDVVNINKSKFEPYGNLVGQAFLKLNDNLISNQYPHSQIENDETPMKMIQKKERQVKLLDFLPSCHKYYQIMELQKL